jgi:two-component system KDP operon response regulator KdpE
MAAGTILVIQDNSIQHKELITVLQKQGYRVPTATDGNEALNHLSNGPVPDLILLDLGIPNGHCDGWWFLQQSQRIPELSDVPILIVSSLAVANESWAASLGADGFLRKPFESDSLLAEIRRCLGDRDGQGP